jgi:Fe-S oxidoreductase
MGYKGRQLVPSGLTYIADNIKNKGNILGLPASYRAGWAGGIKFSEDKSTLFFAGCGYQYADMLEPLVNVIKTADKMTDNPDLPMLMSSIPRKFGIDATRLLGSALSRQSKKADNILKDAINVLKAIGIEPGYLGQDEPCCGAPLYHSGFQQDYALVVRQAYERFAAAGVRRIISIVPSCTYALRDLAGKILPEKTIEVKHFIEVLADNISSIKLEYPQSVKVTYHDPCQLGRYMGLIEQPRRVLKSIKNLELVEAQWTSGEWSTCCGGGGGFEVVFPDISYSLSINRIEELIATGADIIVTQCPGCMLQLRSGLKGTKRENIEVLDLATLVARAII